MPTADSHPSHPTPQSPIERAARLTRRSALGVLGASALAYAVFGPRGIKDTPPGRVILDYWDKWTGQEGLAMRQVVDEFNASQDHIFVRYFSLSAIDQKAMVAISGGDPPDILGLWDFMFPHFAEAGALLPLDELDDAYRAELAPIFRGRYAEPEWVFSQDRYAPPIWNLVRYKGACWGAVSTCSTMALYYNRALFREVGLDPDAPPQTIDELDETSDLLTSYAPDGSLKRAGFVHREPGWWDWIWGYFFGGSLLDDKANATAASPPNLKAYEWLQTYPRRIGPSRMLAFQSGFGGYNSVQQPLLAGKVAMCLHGPFLANVIATFKPDFDYGAAPFPVEASIFDPKRPIGLLESDTLCVPRGCKHPRESFEFIAFVQRRHCLEHLATLHAKPSPLAEVSPGFTASHPNKYIAMHNRVVNSPRAFPKPRTPVWPQYESEFITKMGAMWDLRTDAADALADIQSRGQSIIDLDRTQSRRRYGDTPLLERAPKFEGAT